MPIYHRVYLVKEFEFYLALLKMKIAETQLGAFSRIINSKVQKITLINNDFCQSFAEVSLDIKIDTKQKNILIKDYTAHYYL